MDYNQLLQSIGPYFGAMPNTPVPPQQGQPPPQPGQPQPPQQTQYGMGDILTSPLVQGPLDAFFGYLAGGGRGQESIGQRIGQGGLMGLQGAAQARQQQIQLPLMRQQMAQEQAKTALEQTQAQQAQVQLSGLTPEVAQALNQAKTDAQAKGDKDYMNFINSTESLLRGRQISPEKALENIRQFNDSKRLADMIKAQAMQTGAGFEANIMSRMIPGMAPGAPGGGVGGAPGGGGYSIPIGTKGTFPNLSTGKPTDFTWDGTKWVPASTTP